MSAVHTHDMHRFCLTASATAIPTARIRSPFARLRRLLRILPVAWDLAHDLDAADVRDYIAHRTPLERFFAHRGRPTVAELHGCQGP